MRQLRRDIAEVRRQKRAYVDSKPESALRPRLWEKLIVYGAGLLGIYLITSGDTVERIIGVGLVTPPAVLAAFWVWVYSKGVRMLRDARRRDFSP